MPSLLPSFVMPYACWERLPLAGETCDQAVLLMGCTVGGLEERIELCEGALRLCNLEGWNILGAVVTGFAVAMSIEEFNKINCVTEKGKF